MRPPPKVALLIETARGYGRQMLHGIVRYARLHGPWGFYVTPGDFKQALPKMQHWGGTGIIARIETPQIAKAVLDSGLPAIVLDRSERQSQPDHPLSRFSEVASDSAQAAAMAASHLLERGFRHYAFAGIAGRVWSDLREASFCETVRAAGFAVQVYPAPRARRDRVWEREQPVLAEWLRQLPRPAGLMACNDDRGREVLEACRSAGVRVPEELAVIGVDNDELLCDLSDPPLSSVALNAEGVGYRAAELLDHLMLGRVRKPQRLVAGPLHVVTRRSTEIVAIDDPEVVAALRFLHDHAALPIGVKDIVRQIAISRRNLELRFQAAVGRTLHAELQRVRLERARRLLSETDLPIPAVAQAAGYSTACYFIQVFRRAQGTTPARYRRQLRTGA
jgi:LacI family transcriptional regulator